MFNTRKKKIGRVQERIDTINWLLKRKEGDEHGSWGLHLRDLAKEVSELVSSVEPDEEVSLLLEEADKAEKAMRVAMTETSEQRRVKREKEQAKAHVDVDRRLQPCVRCNSVHFLIRDDVTIECSGPNLELRMVVCAQCGDARFECPSAALLRTWSTWDIFRRYTIEAPDGGPFRGR